MRGVVPIRWDGEIREVPTLKRGASRIWKQSIGGLLADVGVLPPTLDALPVAGDMVTDGMLRLVMSYDASHVLGTSEWIDENVDDSDVYEAFRVLMDVAYPFVTDLRGLITELRGMGLFSTPSVSPESTNTASTSGASRRKR